MYIWTIIENKHCKKKNVIKILIDLEFLTLDSFSETVLGKIQRSRSLKRSVSYAVYDIYDVVHGRPNSKRTISYSRSE